MLFWQDELVKAVESLGFEAKLLGSGDASSLRLQLGGMTCSSCSSAIEAALGATPGVTKASVSLITNTAEVHTPQPSSLHRWSYMSKEMSPCPSLLPLLNLYTHCSHLLG